MKERRNYPKGAPPNSLDMVLQEHNSISAYIFHQQRHLLSPIEKCNIINQITTKKECTSKQQQLQGINHRTLIKKSIRCKL